MRGGGVGGELSGPEEEGVGAEWNARFAKGVRDATVPIGNSPGSRSVGETGGGSGVWAGLRIEHFTAHPRSESAGAALRTQKQAFIEPQQPWRMGTGTLAASQTQRLESAQTETLSQRTPERRIIEGSLRLDETMGKASPPVGVAYGNSPPRRGGEDRRGPT